jgi:hypothetical protein
MQQATLAACKIYKYFHATQSGGWNTANISRGVRYAHVLKKLIFG